MKKPLQQGNKHYITLNHTNYSLKYVIMKNLKIVCKLAVVFLLTLSLTNCKKDNLGDSTQTLPANLTEFFQSLPDWETFSPELSESDIPTGDTVSTDESADIDGTKYDCATTTYSLTETPEKVTTLNPDVEVLYVGSLLEGDGYLNGIGSLAELPIRQRAPITLTLDLLNGDNTQTVENPTVSTVTQAIGDLVSKADDEGHKSGSNIFYTSQVTHSFEQASLKMGLSANYMGATIKASLSSNLSQEKNTIAAYFVQQMFTASMVLPQYPEDVFSGDFTQDILDREVEDGRMGPDNPPVYVSSIVYGRIMMFSFTSTASEADIQATLNAMYNGGEFGGELSTDLQQILSEAEISVVTVGGDADHALSLIKDNNLAAFFTTDAPLTSAKPISYTIRNLKDNSVARVSETTDYNIRECTESSPTGAEYDIQLTRIVAIALPDIDPVLDSPHQAEIYYTFYLEGLAGPQIAANLNKSIIADPTTQLKYYLAISEGESKDLWHEEPGSYKLEDATPIFHHVRLHTDGTDHIRIYGDLWDYDATSTDDQFHFSREFRGDKGLPFADNQKRQFSLDSQDADGNHFRLYGTYQRTKLLYD